MTNIVDFDKTLIKINSFPIWILYLIINYLFYNPNKCFILLFLLVKRKSRKISHEVFKKKLMLLATEDFLNKRFVSLLSIFVNKKVAKIIDGESNVVISAAPFNYIKYVKCYFNSITDIQGTYILNNELIDLYGKNKSKYAKKYGLINKVISDDISDLPIYWLSHNRYFVNKKYKKITQIKKYFPDIIII